MCLDYLERQAEQILRWANKAEKQIISEAELKRQLRKSTHHTEDDILLLFAHLKYSGKMAVESFTKDSEERDAELVICKFAQIDSKKEVVITLKEKGKFALNVNLAKLDQKIEAWQTKVM